MQSDRRIASSFPSHRRLRAGPPKEGAETMLQHTQLGQKSDVEKHSANVLVSLNVVFIYIVAVR